MKRFTRETLEVDKADNKVQLTTFKAGLKSREFVVSLAKNPHKTMAKMLLKTQKYMNAEGTSVVIKDDEKTSEKGRKEDEDKKGSVQIIKLVKEVKGKMKKLLERYNSHL